MPYGEHEAARFQEVVSRIQVGLQHPLIHQQRAHGLRHQDVHLLHILQFLNLAIPDL